MKLTLRVMSLVVLLGAVTSQECAGTEFLCQESGICIPESRVCDGIADCLAGSDEVDCPSTTTTQCSGFQCNDGTCIPSNYQCDNLNDCLEGEDEANCASTSTTPCSGFVCNNGECIPDWYECDGFADCESYEDEIECPCDGFLCPNYRCIPSGFACDGDNDCGDWSDEAENLCPCSDDQIRCPGVPESGIPGICIPTEYVCDADGIWDCPEGEDESNCTNTVDINDMSMKTRYRPETIKAANVRRISKTSFQKEFELKHKTKRIPIERGH